jgi:hypothetical protein
MGFGFVDDSSGLIAGAPESRLSGSPVQPDSAAIDARRDRAGNRQSIHIAEAPVYCLLPFDQALVIFCLQRRAMSPIIPRPENIMA